MKLPTTLPTLRDASVAWTLDAYHHFEKNPEMVQQAWAKSAVGPLNLSWDSLTSDAAMDHVERLLAEDAIFRAGFNSKDPMIPRTADPRGKNYEETNGGEFEESIDDSSAPATDIVTSADNENEIGEPLELAADDFDFNIDAEESNANEPGDNVDHDTDIDVDVDVNVDMDVDMEVDVDVESDYEEKSNTMPDEEHWPRGSRPCAALNDEDDIWFPESDSEANDLPGSSGDVVMDESMVLNDFEDPIVPAATISIDSQGLVPAVGLEQTLNEEDQTSRTVDYMSSPKKGPDEANCLDVSPQPIPHTTLIALNIAVIGSSNLTHPIALASPLKASKPVKPKTTSKKKDPKPPKKKKVPQPTATKRPTKRVKHADPVRTPEEEPLSLRRSRRAIHAPKPFGVEADEGSGEETEGLKPKTRKRGRGV